MGPGAPAQGVRLRRQPWKHEWVNKLHWTAHVILPKRSYIAVVWSAVGGDESNHAYEYLGSPPSLSLQGKLNRGHIDGEGISYVPLLVLWRAGTQPLVGLPSALTNRRHSILSCPSPAGVSFSVSPLHNSSSGQFSTSLRHSWGCWGDSGVLAKQFSSICSNTSRNRELPTSPGSSFCLWQLCGWSSSQSWAKTSFLVTSPHWLRVTQEM